MNKLLMLLFVGLLNISATPFIDRFGILEESDIAILESQKSPAAESPIGEEPHWEEYNHWLCFPTDIAKIQCLSEKESKDPSEFSIEERDSHEYYPTMFIEGEDHLYVVTSPDRSYLETCEKQIQQWQDLLFSQKAFCVFAVKIPPSIPRDDVSDWVIYGLKTLAGKDLAPIYDPNYVEDLDEESASL